MFVQSPDGLAKLFAQASHAPVESIDIILSDETQSGLWKRQGHRMPRRNNAMTNRSNRAEGRMLGVEKLLAGGKELAVGGECFRSLALLGRREGFANPEPLETQTSSRHGGAQLLRGRCRRPCDRFVKSCGHKRLSRCGEEGTMKIGIKTVRAPIRRPAGGEKPARPSHRSSSR